MDSVCQVPSTQSLPPVSQEKNGKAVLGKIPEDDVVANCGAGACEMDKGCDDLAFEGCMNEEPTDVTDGGV